MTGKTIHDYDQINAQLLATLPAFLHAYAAGLMIEKFSPCDALYLAGEAQKAVILGLWAAAIHEGQSREG